MVSYDHFMADVPDKYKDIPGVFSYTLLGRQMWFKPPGNGPLILLQKYRAQLTNMERSGDPGYGRFVMDVTSKTLNVINNQFLDPQDRDWVEEKILMDELPIQDIMPVLSGGKTSRTEDDDKETEVKPRKTAVTQAKKAANAKRTRA